MSGSEEDTEIGRLLESYPVLDENDLSGRETEEAKRVWRSCYDAKERVQYIRENRGDFYFESLADMLGCVRGQFFRGCASELLG